MRDINRISKLTSKLNLLWKEHYPDFRFWQLIGFLFEYAPEEKQGTDPFFWEDDIWEEIINKALESK